MSHEFVSKMRGTWYRESWKLWVELWNRKVGGYVRLQKGQKDWKVEIMGKSSWTGKLEMLPDRDNFLSKVSDKAVASQIKFHNQQFGFDKL